MFDFEKFVARHGEILAQALVENMERHEGIHHQTYKPLCERWHQLMSAEIDTQRLAA